MCLPRFMQKFNVILKTPFRTSFRTSSGGPPLPSSLLWKGLFLWLFAVRMLCVPCCKRDEHIAWRMSTHEMSAQSFASHCGTVWLGAPGRQPGGRGNVVSATFSGWLCPSFTLLSSRERCFLSPDVFSTFRSPEDPIIRIFFNLIATWDNLSLYKIQCIFLLISKNTLYIPE